MQNHDGTPVVLGIDVGGTKLAAGAVAPDGTVSHYQRIPTPQHAGAETLFAAVRDLIAQVQEASSQQIGALGVGCGGPMLYPAGIVSPLHIPGWQAFPLRDRLAEAFALPTILDNDAKAFAIGEALFGAGRGAPNMMGVTISTGVGGGIVRNGILYHGDSGNAGHIGHVIVSAEGPRCACGAIGCLTAYASGTGMAERARDALRDGEQSSLRTLPAAEITGQQIAQAAAEGDPLAQRLFDEAGQALARGIVSVVNLLDINRVVLGGGIMQSGDVILAPFHKALRQCLRLDYMQHLDVRMSELGPYAGIVGAAALAFAGGIMTTGT
jgi:glucokinase